MRSRNPEASPGRPPFQTVPLRSELLARVKVGFESGVDQERTKVLKAKNAYTVVVHSLDKIHGSALEHKNFIHSNALGDFKTEVPYVEYIEEDECVLADIVQGQASSGTLHSFVRAGPREVLPVNPKTAVAAVVTCGGLCPGLNNIIHDTVLTLWHNYGVRNILGIKCGYRGFYDSQYLPPLQLTPTSVEGITSKGGTILGSSRGGAETEKIAEAILKAGITQVYVIGGDGTHRGALKLADYFRDRSLPVSVCGIPKTIDNDIGIIDRSFGFNTAVEEAVRAVQCAAVEAKCAPNGIGIVKLMGREAGFVAAHTTLASREVNLCLVPEVPFQLEGADGILPYLEAHVKRHGNAVVVVAEGAGHDILPSSGTDPSGNKKLPEIGLWLKNEVSQYFEKKSTEATVKYIDPSYMIRSTKANSGDSMMCLLLAQQAVHGAMAGFTGFTTGVVNNRTVYIPIAKVVEVPRRVRSQGRTWQRVLSCTGQTMEPSAI